MKPQIKTGPVLIFWVSRPKNPLKDRASRKSPSSRPGIEFPHDLVPIHGFRPRSFCQMKTQRGGICRTSCLMQQNQRAAKDTMVIVT